MSNKLKHDERAKQIMYKAGYYGYSTMFVLGSVALFSYLLFKPLDETFVLLLIFVPLVTGVIVVNYRLKKDGYWIWQRDEINRKPNIRKRIPWIIAFTFVLTAGAWFISTYYYSDLDMNAIVVMACALVFSAFVTRSMYRTMYRPIEQEQIEE